MREQGTAGIDQFETIVRKYLERIDNGNQTVISRLTEYLLIHGQVIPRDDQIREFVKHRMEVKASRVRKR